MNDEAQMQQPETSSSAMIRTLAGIAMLSGFLVVLTFQLTKPYIEENQRVAIEKAVFEVVPGAVQKINFEVQPGKLQQWIKGAKGTQIYAGYDAEGNLKGIAANASAVGYAGAIYFLYGYDPSCECIRGLKVLKMAETPGLGDKIITDANFVANFNALDARLNEDKSRLTNAIVTVKAGTKKNPWEIDAISGATISSDAAGKALNTSAQVLLPMLMPHIEVIKQAGGREF